MQKITYLQENLKDTRIIRWPDNCFPLKVYIAPFKWYAAQNESYKYRQMILDAMKAWENASNGKIRFEVVNILNDSLINIEWRRVDRKSLGHCYYHFDKIARLYSAEIQIGLSDGVLHSKYMDENEVYHTILHEIGHSIGLGHSPNKADIMYTPHQYGSVHLSQGDIESIQWLYKFPCGASVKEIAQSYSMHYDNIDDVILALKTNKPTSDFEKVKNSLTIEERDLLEEQAKIAELKKYHLSLQNIQINKNFPSN